MISRAEVVYLLRIIQLRQDQVRDFVLEVLQNLFLAFALTECADKTGKE